jgi:hypothetical protein
MGKPLAGASRGRAPLAAFAVACFCRRGVAGRADRPAEEGAGGPKGRRRGGNLLPAWSYVPITFCSFAISCYPWIMVPVHFKQISPWITKAGIMRRQWSCVLFVLLLFSSGRSAFAVKSLKLSIPKDQPIVIEVPQSQWAVKETSWTGGIPISVLRADGDFLNKRQWEDGSLPVLADFHIEKAQDCGSGVMSGRIVGCPPNWKQLELRSGIAWLKVQFPPEVTDLAFRMRRS